MVSPTTGLMVFNYFNFFISTHSFISKLWKTKLLLIQRRFLKKCFQDCKQAVGNNPVFNNQWSCLLVASYIIFIVIDLGGACRITLPSRYRQSATNVDPSPSMGAESQLH